MLVNSRSGRRRCCCRSSRQLSTLRERKQTNWQAKLQLSREHDLLLCPSAHKKLQQHKIIILCQQLDGMAGVGVAIVVVIFYYLFWVAQQQHK